MHCNFLLASFSVLSPNVAPVVVHEGPEDMELLSSGELIAGVLAGLAIFSVLISLTAMLRMLWSLTVVTTRTMGRKEEGLFSLQTLQGRRTKVHHKLKISPAWEETEPDIPGFPQGQKS